MLIENMIMAFSAIRANKMRSFLTMLGIIIGIGSVISIVSIGDSMRAMFAGLYEEIGLTRAYIFVSWDVDEYRQTDAFDLDELERIKEIFGDKIDYIDSEPVADTEAIYKRNKVKYTLTGIDYNYSDVMTLNIVQGRNFTQADILGRKNNVLLEEQGAIELFGTTEVIGKTFRAPVYGSIDEYVVVGIYRKNQTPLEALLMGAGDKKEGFLPYTLLTRPNDTFQMINMYAKDDVDIDELGIQIKQYVAKVKNREIDEIEFFTAKDQMKTWDSMLGGVSVAVGGIAGISLLVGGIGIMNIMLVSVTERTREIGIRKALGARTKDILIQFLTESAILSACGGVIGVGIGVGLVTVGGAAFAIKVVVNPIIIIIAVGFSAMVGISFGLYPALKAAKADPIDALRYE